MYATSPDLGGDTYTEFGSVPVVANVGAAPPTVSIGRPANNANLGQTLSYNFHANATPATDLAIDYVDLQVDNGARTIKFAPPYQVTIAPNELTPGAHVLSATAHQNDGQTAFASVTVHVAAPPSVSVVPPAGFTQLDTAKTFKSNAAPGAGAPGVTITSVAYAVDGDSIGATTTAPYSKVVDPASLSLGAGPHTLTATATDSTGQHGNLDRLRLHGAAGHAADRGDDRADRRLHHGQRRRGVAGAGDEHLRRRRAPRAPHHRRNGNRSEQHHHGSAVRPGRDQRRPEPAGHDTHVPVHRRKPTFVCDLPDIPANSSLSSPFRIFVTTNGVVTGSTIAGQATATAVNADNVSGALGTVNVITCGSQCVIGVAAPGDPFASSPDAPTAGEPDEAGDHVVERHPGRAAAAGHHGHALLDQPEPGDGSQRRNAVPDRRR